MLNIKYSFDEHNSYIKMKSIKNMLMKHMRFNKLMFDIPFGHRKNTYCRVAMPEIEFGLKWHYPPIRLKSH